MSWWVIEDVALRDALKRAQEGEDPGGTSACSLFANSSASMTPDDERS